ncbi:MAG TPA: DUF378 domain-containing protein [Kofleriaceae bacterium]|nr:DUF378 domain-containing protein [Kofleriaceae bacterium]
MTAAIRTSIIIASLGAVSWGVIGLFDVNLLDAIFGTVSPTATRVVYGVIGACGLLVLMVLPPKQPRYDFGHRQY